MTKALQEALAPRGYQMFGAAVVPDSLGPNSGNTIPLEFLLSINESRGAPRHENAELPGCQLHISLTHIRKNGI